jgi:TolA-binding protein
VKGQVGEPPAAPASEPAKTDEAAKDALTPKAPAAATAEAAGGPSTEAPKETPKEPVDTMENQAYLVSGQQAMARGISDKALTVAQNLLAKPEITKDMREQALYLQAEAIFAQNKDKMPAAFEQTNDALQQALNYNTTSQRVPRALIKLGYINLRQGNIPEARAYFNLMRNKYPLDEEIPLIDVYWGEHFMEQAKVRDPKTNYDLASQSFKEVLQKNPESRFARDASLDLSRCLFELGQYDEANKIIDYIDKRWPRYYLENPSMRRVSADISYKLGDFAKAKDDYLWFYNLVPDDPSNDLVLARLGDVSVRLNQMDAARDFYDMAIRLYPGKEGALMAMMREAEQGIHDSPDLQEMVKTFADPKDINPEKIYEIIVGEYPKSPLAPLALLKLAMWNMYKQAYPRALELADRLIKEYPGNELEKQAIELAAQAFTKMIGPLLEGSDYKRILELWRSYPYVASRTDLFTDHDRLGVALAFYYQGAPKEALTMVEPYLDKGPTPDAQKALALILTIYRENQDWQALLDTVNKVESWRLGDNPRRTLEFAQAMALEHTGDRAKSSLLWARLVADNQLDPAKRAYAVYYQARTAYDRKDYDQCIAWAQDSRTLFKEAAKDEGMARDALLVMIQANQSSGRFREALNLCEQYGKEAPEDSAEWAANRLRMATLYRLLGNMDQWKKVLEEMRDKQSGTLYGKLAASELSSRGLEERAGKLK